MEFKFKLFTCTLPFVKFDVYFFFFFNSGSSVKQGTVHRGDRDSRNGCNTDKNSVKKLAHTQQFAGKK